MSSQFVQLSGGRLVYAALIDLFQSVEAMGCELSLDAEGEVQVSHEDRLSEDMRYELQSSCRSVHYWLLHKAAPAGRV
jgi:hypothetical protein